MRTLTIVALMLLATEPSSFAADKQKLQRRIVSFADSQSQLIIRLPSDFEMKLINAGPPDRYYYFGCNTERDVVSQTWVCVTIGNRAYESQMLQEATTPIPKQRDHIAGQRVTWLAYETRRGRHVFHRETYLRNFERFATNSAAARALQGTVVTICIGGIYPKAVKQTQDWVSRMEFSSK